MRSVNGKPIWLKYAFQKHENVTRFKNLSSPMSNFRVCVVGCVGVVTNVEHENIFFTHQNHVRYIECGISTDLEIIIDLLLFRHQWPYRNTEFRIRKKLSQANLSTTCDFSLLVVFIDFLGGNGRVILYRNKLYLMSDPETDDDICYRY